MARFVHHTALSLIVCSASLILPAPSLHAAEPAPDARFTARHGSRAALSRNDVQVFVRLTEPSVAELNIESMARNGMFAAPPQQQAQAARASAQQERVRQRLAAHGATVLSAHRIGANGLRVRVRPAEIAALRALPEVRSVGRVITHRPDNIDSVPWIGAPAVWAALGKGENIRIGIIDTGIDYTHANFGGSGNPGDYAGNDPNLIEPGTFPTAKVVGGYDFAGANYDADSDDNNVPTPDPDPLDRNGHGTHVAGTAAGLGIAGTIGAGVAPAAKLYALKVFGDTEGSTDVTSLAIEWAMDPNADGDMSDHLDVINMSLGSPFGDPDDPTSIAATNAVALGIIVVASAGNEGRTPYVTGSPAVAPQAISVAATRPGGDHLYARFRVLEPAALAGIHETEEGSGPVTVGDVGVITGNLVPSSPADGCTPLTNAAAVNGNIALVIRGTCGFVDKYLNAQAAGARAIVVYNDGTDPTRIDPIVMGGLDDRVTIPGVMISYTLGAALAAAGGGRVTLEPAPDFDVVTSFSSLGPGHDSSFKPDISAPGLAIVSAAAGTGTEGVSSQGTSMAAPHVAGAAALLRQKHPKLRPAGIKALLQNSTVPANSVGDTRLTRQGVGVVRVDRAAALSSYAAPGGVSFGRLNPLVPIRRQQDIVVHNLTQRTRSYHVEHVPNRTYPGVHVSCPDTVRVRGATQTRARIALSFDPRTAWRRTSSGDDGSTSQTEIDGWCVLKDGKDTLRVGYIAVVDPASAILTLPGRGLRSVQLRNIGPAFGIAEGFTLAQLGGEEDKRTAAAISATGFRTNTLAGFSVVEFGIALRRPFENLSTFEFDLLIDTNGDGTEDIILVGADLSAFDPNANPGAFVTAQFTPDGSGFLDWFVNSWDYNDRTLILPFTRLASEGLLPDKFDYTLVTFAADDSIDVQSGSVDLSREIRPDLNSIGIDPGDHVNVQMNGPSGTTLWLLPNDIPAGQVGLSYTTRSRR